MRCPSCGYAESKVVDSRPSEDGASIRRRRECLDCGRRFTTYERLGDNPLVIVKSDGSSEAYNREKLFRGVLIACAKRPISSEQVTSLIDDIEAELRNDMKNEIKSKDLGNMVLARLRKLDDVAYVRFASVYKDFQNIEEFATALEGLD
ncbi:transcriptional regulator NrdR [Raoultibacter massiliensis]|uniref:Transcriptional repressor NrdR n=1 Tax=Raoultibacter massiliensis TaxID=1852371 RepID=A0ABV1JC40_9ACTN|nr:transcriptional regulator NrdR [Raoultibacter massiliensis]